MSYAATQSSLPEIPAGLANVVELAGYAGRSPDYVRIDEKRRVARFSIGTHRLFREKSGRWKRETDWHTVVAWNYLADQAVTLIQPGSKVFIKGRLRSIQKDKDRKQNTEIYIMAQKITARYED